MPALFIKKLNSNTIMGVWLIDREIKADDVCPKSACEKISRLCKKRQEETVAVYALLKEILKSNAYATDAQDTDGLVISHNINGKPILSNGWQISISHTIGYASVIVSRDKNVAVDIEYINGRIFKIYNRFLTSTEVLDFEQLSQNESLEQKRTRLLLYWCAKETAYKYFSEEKLMFEDMTVSIGTKFNESGKFDVTNQKSGRTIGIEYMQNDNFVLTFTY